MTPLSLMMLTHYFEDHRGGIEIVAGRLAREFAELGNSITWLATGDRSPAAIPGVDCVALSASNMIERLAGLPYPLLYPSAWRKIFAEIASHDAVVIHDGIYLTSLAGWLAARRYGKPCILIQHIGEVPYRNPVLRGLMKLANALLTKVLLRRVDRVVFISEITRRFFDNVRLRHPSDFIVNGVDTQCFHPAQDAPEVAALRSRFGLPARGPICLFVGRYVEKKGLPLMRLLAQRCPDVAFAFAGWGPLDPAQWSLANVNTFPGLSGSSLADLYRSSDVFILPSIGEGFPLVLQEALASGLPAICGEDTATADPAATPLLAAVQIDPAQPEATASRLEVALRETLAQPRDAEALHSFALTHYAWAQTASRYMAILQELTEQG